MKALDSNIKRKPKANYKIFNTRNGRYVSSGSSSKTTWNSTHWVYEKLKDLQRYSVNSANVLSDFEIHIFPIETAIVKSAKEFVDEMKATEQEKTAAKMSLENQRKKADLTRKSNQLKKELEKIRRQIESL